MNKSSPQHKTQLPEKKPRTIKSFAGVELPTEVPTGSHTEIRFTRPFQALPAGIAAALCLTAGILLGSNLLIRLFTGWQGPWWPILLCLALLAVGFFLARHSLYCLKHAYLILSPIGIEIFPLRKPEKTFRVLSWGDLAAIHWEVKPELIQVDLRSGGGVFLSLKPLWPKSRPLLKHVLQARAKELNFDWHEGNLP